jgi:hypothetical protein
VKTRPARISPRPGDDFVFRSAMRLLATESRPRRRVFAVRPIIGLALAVSIFVAGVWIGGRWSGVDVLEDVAESVGLATEEAVPEKRTVPVPRRVARPAFAVTGAASDKGGEPVDAAEPAPLETAGEATVSPQPRAIASPARTGSSAGSVAAASGATRVRVSKIPMSLRGVVFTPTLPAGRVVEFDLVLRGDAFEGVVRYPVPDGRRIASHLVRGDFQGSAVVLEEVHPVWVMDEFWREPDLANGTIGRRYTFELPVGEAVAGEFPGTWSHRGESGALTLGFAPRW